MRIRCAGSNHTKALTISFMEKQIFPAEATRTLPSSPLSFGQETGTWTLDTKSYTLHLPGFVLNNDAPLEIGADTLLSLTEIADRNALQDALLQSQKGNAVFDVTIGLKPPEMGVRFLHFHGERLAGESLVHGVVHDVTQSYRHARALTDLHLITSRAGISLDQKIDQILDLGLTYFGLQIALLSTIKDDLYTVRNSRAVGIDPPPVGAEFPLGITYCWHTLNASGPLGFHHVAESHIHSHPCYHTFGLESYIGAPITVGGNPFGTLNFSSTCPAPNWHAKDLDLVRLMAQWVGLELDGHFMQVRLNEEIEKSRATDRARTTFLAKLSHELRTPLNAILGHVQLLERTPIAPEQLEHMNGISDAVTNFAATANTLLELLNLDLQKTKPDTSIVDLNDLLKSFSDTFTRHAEQKKLEFIFDISPSVPKSIICIDSYLKQSLEVLIGNAIKFTDTGHVTISVTKSSDTHHSAALQWSVSDSGVGIPEAQIDSLFKPFTQKDESHTRAHGGLGLGLTLCKSLTDAMDGRIWVTNNREGGSVFNLLIPYAPNPEESDALFPTLSGVTDLNVLILSPGKQTKHVLETIFASSGAQSEMFSSVSALKAHMSGLAPESDLLVLIDTAGLTGTLPEVITDLSTTEPRHLIRFALLTHQTNASKLTEFAKSAHHIVALQTPINPQEWCNFDLWLRLVTPEMSLPTVEKAKTETTRRDENWGCTIPGTPGWPVLEGFNVPVALKRVNNNTELYLMLLEEFIKEYATTVTDIRAHITRNELEDARRIAHTIKGVAGNIGADQLALTAAELDRTFKAGEDPSEDLKHFEAQMTVSLKDLTDFVRKTNGETTTPTEDTPTDPATHVAPDTTIKTREQIKNGVGSHLKTLQSQLQQQDMAALTLMTEIAASLDGETQKAMELLTTSIDNLDFDAALLLLEPYLSDLTPSTSDVTA